MKFYIDRKNTLDTDRTYTEYQMDNLIKVNDDTLDGALRRYISICSTARDLRDYPKIQVFSENAHNEFSGIKLSLFYVQNMTSDRRGLSPVFAKSPRQAIERKLRFFGESIKSLMKTDECWVFDHELSNGEKFTVIVNIDVNMQIREVTS